MGRTEAAREPQQHGRWEPRRFACAVVGSWLVHLTLGTFYCWGNITPYVTSYLRWQGHDVNYEASSRVVALAAVFFGGSIYFGGRLHCHMGLKGAALLGGWMLSLGTAASSATLHQGLPLFIPTYSVLFGLGSGLAYTAPIVCLMRWLPQRRGLATGLVVLGYGAGAFLFDPFQAALVNPNNLLPMRTENDGQYFDWEDPLIVKQVLERVPRMFLVLALVYGAMQALGAWMLLEPLPASAPQPELEEALLAPPEDSASKQEPDEGRQYSVREMLRTWQYWLLVANFACTTTGVFLATSFSKTLGTVFISEGLSDAKLTTITAVSSLFNGLGRLLWGSACDRCSFREAMSGMCCLQAALLATLPLCSTCEAYSAWTCLIFLCVGGNYSMFPAATAAYFGRRNVGANYGLVILGMSFTMLWAPELAKAMLACCSGAALCRATALFVLAGSLLAFLNQPPGSSQGPLGALRGQA